MTVSKKRPTRPENEKAKRPSGNRLLDAMAAPDRALLESDLQELAMPLRFNLEIPNVQIKTIYFVNHGIASVVAISGRNTQVEVGLIGCEGASGTAVTLGSDRSPHHTYMQVAGHGLCMPVAVFRKALAGSATLQKLMLRYALAFGIQTTHTAMANARGNLEQRLARWILMAIDRVPAGEVPLTHEFLSIMLGVRRAGVTDSLHALTKRDVIRRPRNGLIEVLDRKGLEEIAGPFYGAPEREYKRLMQ